MGDNLTAVDLGTGFVPLDIAAGCVHVCVISESKTVKCWGECILCLSVCPLHSFTCTQNNDIYRKQHLRTGGTLQWI